MNNSERQTLMVIILSAILFVTLLVVAFALRGAYKLGQAHPNLELYCANDPDLPSDIAAIGMRAGNEAGLGSGIHYEVRHGTYRILVPQCGDTQMPPPPPPPGRAGLGPASKFYRDNPAGRVPDDSAGDNATNGVDPSACRDDPASSACRVERVRALACSDKSKYYFNLGEADMARGTTSMARDEFEKAISYGRECGSQYAVLAAKRLSALNLPCEYTTESLARISLDADQVVRDDGVTRGGGQVIPLANRKQALKALGYYDGPIDSVYGPNTRAAIQKFERDFGFEETGDLTPLETVYLVCSAAQNANDAKSVNVLGIMYVTGLGVVQNTDTGLTWLKKAASRGEPSALYNLALLYGTGVILSSYQLCDLPEDVQIADSYLGEAAARGQPAANEYLHKYGGLSAVDRWNKITKDEEDKSMPVAGRGAAKPPIYLQKIGRGCQVNPNP